jgi:dienelactone hydrolase
MSRRFSACKAACAIAMLLLPSGCGADTPRVRVTPKTSASDQVLKIVLDRLPKQTAVSVTVTSTDAAHVVWANVVKLHTDENGSLNVPTSVLAGMQPTGASAFYYSWPTSSASRFRVSVSYAGRTRASAEFARRALEQPIAERPVTLSRDGVVGRYFAPSGDGPQPGLVLVGGSEGGLAPYGLGLSRAIASRGIRVLDLAYWSYPGLPSKLDKIPIGYFARGVRWLARQPHVDQRRITVEGISYGSEAALLLGVYYPHLVNAVVVSVPSNLATECYGGNCNGTDPAWTYRGRDIKPFSPIPVERIDGPIFAICGTHDLIWPSCPQAHAILTRRRAHHVRFHDILVAGQGAGHFVGAAIPYQIYRFDPTYTQRAVDETGAELAWPQLIKFLQRAK